MSDLRTQLGSWLAVLAAVMVLVAPVEAQQQVTVAASAPDEAYVGDSIPLRIQIEGASNAQPPDVGALDRDFEVHFNGPQNNSSSVTVIVNGRMQQRVEKSTVYSYTLMARKAGEFTIPSIAVRVGSRELTTQPLRIRVVEPSEAKGLAAAISAKRAYVGQAIKLTVHWTLQAAAEDPSLILNLPPDAFDVQPLSVQGGGQGGQDGQGAEIGFALRPGAPWQPVRGRLSTVNIDGDARNVFTTEFLLVPKLAGRHTIGPARVDYRSVIGRRPRSILDSPFESNTITQRQYSIAQPETLEVLDLPTRNRPPGFEGLVGKFKLDASCSPREASVGDPLSLSLVLSSSLPLVDAPTIDLSRQTASSTDSQGGIASLFRVPRDPVLPQVTGQSAVYSAQIRPRSAKVLSVPPIEVWYFDPDDAEYKVARSSPVSLSIKPSAAVGLGALEGLEEDDPQLTSEQAKRGAQGSVTGLPEKDGAFYPPLNLGSSVSPLSASERLSVVHLAPIVAVPGALMLAGSLIAWVRHRRERDPAAHRRRGAARRVRRALRAARTGDASLAIAAAMRGLVGDLFDLPTSSLTTGESVAAAARLDPVLGSRLRSLLNACDEQLFGPSTPREVQAAGVDEAMQLAMELSRAVETHGSTRTVDGARA